MSVWSRVDPVEAAIVRKFMSTPPVRVGEVADALGIDVVRAPLPPKISGLIQPFENGRSGYQIKVNKYEVPERQRFTIAHEIGHFLLHKEEIRSGVVDSIMYRSTLTSRKEAEANRMAADIIMPSLLVTQELERRGGVKDADTVDELAALFKVSSPAMKVRLGIA